MVIHSIQMSQHLHNNNKVVVKKKKKLKNFNCPFYYLFITNTIDYYSY